MTSFYEPHAGFFDQNTLFLHGNLASHRWWHPTVRELKNLGSRGPGTLILSDWRGCGENEPWPIDQAFSLIDLAQDQLELLDRLAMKSDVAVVGHSLGGLIALQMMILDPSRFSRAVLLDPVGARGIKFDDSMYEAFRQMARDPKLTRAVILSTILNAEKLSEDFKTLISRDAYKAVQGIGASVLQILKSVDLSVQATSVRVPTLILHGEKDQIIPKADSEDLNSLMPNAELELRPEQGHCWNVEDPGTFAKRLRSFLCA